MSASYQPNRSSPKWLVGAPKPVLACYDSGPHKGADRYTVLYGAPFWEPRLGRSVPYLAMSSIPFHPVFGIALHGEMESYNRSALGRKIRFADLPEDCRRCVIQDCADEGVTP